MKKLDLGQTITILANLGVIAGIVFLAVEIGQNNELLEAEARAARNEKAAVMYAAPYSNPTLATALAKLRAGGELTPTEAVQIESYVFSQFRNIEGNYGEIRLGRLDGAGPIQAWRNNFHNNYLPWSEYWDTYKLRATLEFVEWFEGNVVNVRE